MDYRDRRPPLIEAYTSALSITAGQSVGVCCSTDLDEVAVEVARVGRERRVVWTRIGVPATYQDVPRDAASRGCGWDVTFEVDSDPDWSSGYYEVTVKGHDPESGLITESVCFFAVRPTRHAADRAHRMLLVLATNTYNAYNDWGGKNLYNGGVRCSFERPWAPGLLSKPEPHMRYPGVDGIDDPDHTRFRAWTDLYGLSRWSGSAGWYNWERPFVRWAERCGYAVDVAVNSDLELHPEVVEGYSLVLSVGHDEYWSWAMRDTLEAYIAEGGNCAFFSGNSVCWQVRYEDDGRTMVSYKTDYAQDPVLGTEREHLLTTAWCSARLGRPENLLTGVSFSRGGYIRMGQAVPHGSGGYTVWRPNHWVYSGTGVRYGDIIGTRDMITVYEVDGCDLALSASDGLPVATGRDGTPGSFEVVATAPARLWDKDEQPSRYRPAAEGDLEWFAQEVFGDTDPPTLARLAHNHAVMGVYTNGGTVFTAGTTDWAYGLSGRDPVVEQMTRNILDRFTRRGLV
jgi:hypothetical protein